MNGRIFEQLGAAEVARWSHEVTAEDVDSFAQLSGDVNPLHLDDDFARQHGFRGRVVHGMLVSAFLSRVLGTLLPGPGTLWLSQTTRFPLPVFIGDRVDVVVRVKHKSEALRTLVLETTVLNQAGDTVLDGEARVMLLEQRQTVPWNEMVAVVSGSSRGIGAAIALGLGEKGARVVVNYNQQHDAADEVVSAIKAVGGEAVAVQADVSTVEGASGLADAALNAFGRVDVVVSNATPPIENKPILDLTWEEMDRYSQTFVQSAFTLAQRTVPGMKERGFGRIVNILTSYIWGQPPQEMAGYVSAKSALWGLTKALAVDLAPDGITANAISPSPIMTDQWAKLSDRQRRAMGMRAPLKRLGMAEDVAQAVLYCVGEGGRFLTGVNLPVAGGEVMQ